MNFYLATFTPDPNAPIVGQSSTVPAVARQMHITPPVASTVPTNMGASYSEKEWNAPLCWKYPKLWKKNENSHLRFRTDLFVSFAAETAYARS